MLLGRQRNELTSYNHDRAGQNVLYLGGSVVWAETAAVGVDDDNIYLAGDVLEYAGDEAPADDTDSFLLPAYTPNAW